MKNQTIDKFGHTYYLIGKRKDGRKVYMRDFSWDCGWYWAGGYLTVLGRNDIDEHYHLNGLMVTTNLYDGIKEHFEETVLSDEELWQFCDLMASFYTLKKSAEVVGNGGSHYTKSTLTANQEIAEYLNNIIKNEIAPKIREMLK